MGFALVNRKDFYNASKKIKLAKKYNLLNNKLYEQII